MSLFQVSGDMRCNVLAKASEQLSAAHMPSPDLEAWIEACTRGKTAVSTSGAMAHLLERSVESYSYLNARARRWAIDDGCESRASHAEMWSAARVCRLSAHYQTQDGEQAKPSYRRIVLVAIERMMRVTAPQIDTRFILDEINALPRDTSDEAKLERMQDCEALWDCGQLLIDNPNTYTRSHGDPDVTRRTGVQIAALSEWALRLQEFTHIEIWFDRDPPGNHPHPCLTRSFGQLYLEFLREKEGAKASPPTQPVSARLTCILDDFIAGLRERQRGKYDGRRLWVSSREGPLNANGIYKQIVAKTETMFGLAVNPHLFRDCRATSESQRAPDAASIAHLILGNTPPVARENYDHSGTREAGILMSGYSNAIVTAQLERWSSDPSQHGSLRARVLNYRRSR